MHIDTKNGSNFTTIMYNFYIAWIPTFEYFHVKRKKNKQINKKKGKPIRSPIY